MTQLSHGAIRKRTWTYCEQHKAAKVCREQGCRKSRQRLAYFFDVIVNGERVRKQYPSKPEAEAAFGEFRDEKRNAPPAAVLVKPSMALGQAFEKFLALKVQHDTAAEFRRVAKHLMAAFGSDTLLEAITAERISTYKAERLAVKRDNGQRLTAAAVNRPLGLLRSLLRQAKKWKVLEEVPEIEFEDEPQGRLQWLTPEEAMRLLAAAKQSRNAALADLVEFAMFTGVRRGEALSLTWNNVDRARGVIVLVKTKNDKPREVQLSRNADAVLARRWTPGASGLVFGSRNWNSFRQAWSAAVKAAGISRFRLRFHDLRHTTASWLVQQGRSLREVQELLGHSDIKITMRYAHLAPDHLRAAVASLDTILPPAVVGAQPTLDDETQAVIAARRQETSGVLR
jgi:integrase